jgi:hypothetical protein
VNEALRSLGHHTVYEAFSTLDCHTVNEALRSLGHHTVYEAFSTLDCHTVNEALRSLGHHTVYEALPIVGRHTVYVALGTLCRYIVQDAVEFFTTGPYRKEQSYILVLNRARCVPNYCSFEEFLNIMGLSESDLCKKC